MKYSREKLLEIAAPYLKDVDLVHVTEDNQVFYNAQKNAASAHSRIYKVRLYTFTKDDLVVSKEPVKEDKEDKDEKQVLIDMAKELGVKADKRMSIAKIEELIKDKQDAGE